MTTKYHVCWGPDAVAFVEVPDGSAFQTGQPNDESFTDQDEAALRAWELDFKGFKTFNLNSEFEAGCYVKYSEDLYKALVDVFPYEEDKSALEPVPAPLPPLSPSIWKLISIEKDLML